jgi:uncharacterized membrane protein (UPF0127 family)
MAWLVRDGDVLATLEVPSTRRGRSRGLLGRDGIEGALLIRPFRPTSVIHTVGMRFAIDVAYLDRDLRVLGVTSMARWRVGYPRFGARAVVEAEAGAFARWSLRPGDLLETQG